MLYKLLAQVRTCYAMFHVDTYHMYVWSPTRRNKSSSKASNGLDYRNVVVLQNVMHNNNSDMGYGKCYEC